MPSLRSPCTASTSQCGSADQAPRWAHPERAPSAGAQWRGQSAPAAPTRRRAGWDTLCCARSAETAPAAHRAARLGGGMRKPEVAAVVVDVLVNRQRTVQRVVLRHHADKLPRLRRMLHHVDPGNAHRAAGGQCACGADADGRGLARAIRAQQAKNLASLHARDRCHPQPRRAACPRKPSSVLPMQQSTQTRSGRGLVYLFKLTGRVSGLDCRS
jgi:hypothetical protein